MVLCFYLWMDVNWIPFFVAIRFHLLPLTLGFRCSFLHSTQLCSVTVLQRSIPTSERSVSTFPERSKLSPPSISVLSALSFLSTTSSPIRINFRRSLFQSRASTHSFQSSGSCLLRSYCGLFQCLHVLLSNSALLFLFTHVHVWFLSYKTVWSTTQRYTNSQLRTHPTPFNQRKTRPTTSPPLPVDEAYSKNLTCQKTKRLIEPTLQVIFRPSPRRKVKTFYKHGNHKRVLCISAVPLW